MGTNAREEEVQKALGQLQMKMIDIQNSLRKSGTQIEGYKREIQRSKLTDREINSLKANVPMYSPVGRIYGLKPNDAILAGDEHKDLVERLLHDHTYDLVAGGSTQNTMRAAVWLLQQPNVATYMGCVGRDKYGQLMQEEGSKAGLIVSYEVNPDHSTGTCAVLITENNRSLVANLAAANHFTMSHLDKVENWAYVEKAKIIYTAVRLFEARSFAKAQLKLDTEDIPTIAKALSELSKKNSTRPRVVVITQGSDPTIMAIKSEVRSFEVKTAPKIVDTNGAGDSFVGGFLAYLALNKNHDECVQAGTYVAYEYMDNVVLNSTNSTSSTSQTTSTPTTTTVSSSSSSRPTHSSKRTFSESDSSSRTERHLYSFSHMWIINYLSSYIDDSGSPNCLQSEQFSPIGTPYSNTNWSLKLYPRGVNDKQHNYIAIFLKYVSGTTTNIKAKAEFNLISRQNELVMLRSTNFHMFNSGSDWGYSEFLDSTYLNSRRSDLLNDDRLRVYVRVIIVDEKEHNLNNDLLLQQQQLATQSKISASCSSSSSTASSSSSVAAQQLPPISTASSLPVTHHYYQGLFSDDKERLKSIELLSKQIKTLFDEQKFTDVNIHVIPKQQQQQKEQTCSSWSCCSCCEQQQEQDTQVLNKDHHHDQTDDLSSRSNSIVPTTTRRATRSTSRIAQSSSDSTSCSTSSSNCGEESSTLSFKPTKRSTVCLCFCHHHTHVESRRYKDDIHVDETSSSSTESSLDSYYAVVRPLATYHAHKAILMARSSAFAQQISHAQQKQQRTTTTTKLNHIEFNGNECNTPLDIYIDGLKPSTVYGMLTYMYAGRIDTKSLTTGAQDDQSINPIDLYRASVIYDLHELRDISKYQMLEVLKSDTAVEMLEVADEANDYELKQQVLSYIRSNAAAVSKTDGWLNFSKKNPHLLIDAFRSLVIPPNNSQSTETTKCHHRSNLKCLKQD
ncbi:unnamed protein product [Didymodactylos carnosus]|uniref:adenosine kinase n=1 Tax=Didymodactylos carnosus TaxID=1234261 RepID=A0A8S2CKI8_9BILA|nr:unnamed protein product [Didymodactylos carnosus]CAF3502591.1 unnamed protein product [Didymodactylos carnosus]